MSPFRRSAAVPQEAEAKARRALARTEAVLQQYRRNGLTTVAIEDVLDLLGTDPDTAPERAPQTAMDPLIDRMTGARWAGPPGTRPPG